MKWQNCQQLNAGTEDSGIVVRNKILISIIVLTAAIQAAAMSVEEEQRFLYYYYAAQRAWISEDYAKANDIFGFCYLLNPDDASVNLYIGNYLAETGDKSKALEFFRRAYELNPTECWRSYAVTLFNSHEAKQQKQALRIMEETAKREKDDLAVREDLIQGYISVKDYKNAVKIQKQVDNLMGYSAYSALNYYRLNVMMGKPKKAIDEVERYLEEDPNNLQFQLFRVQLYEVTHVKASQLENAYQKILKLDPHNLMILNNYAYLLSNHKGDLQKAEKMSRQTIQEEPNNPTFLDTYAWILFLQDQDALAEFYIRRAIDSLNGQEIPNEIKQHYDIIIQAK